MVVLVSDGHLPFPYGREVTGYEVTNFSDTLAKAMAAGANVLVAPYSVNHRKRAKVPQ